MLEKIYEVTRVTLVSDGDKNKEHKIRDDKSKNGDIFVGSKRIPITPLPVILRLHSCGECGLGIVWVLWIKAAKSRQERSME